MDQLFTENLYNIPEPPVLVLPTPLESRSAEGQKTILNLCQAIRSKPAPRVVVVSEQGLREEPLPGQRLIAFGFDLKDLAEDRVESFRGAKLIRTAPPEDLAGDPGRKKVLWAAVQALLAG